MISLAEPEPCLALHRAASRLMGEPSEPVLPLGGIRELPDRRASPRLDHDSRPQRSTEKIFRL